MTGGEERVEVSIDIEGWSAATPDGEAVEDFARRVAVAALEAAGGAGSSAVVSLLLTGDERIATLNRAHRARGEATNVLSWPASDVSAPMTASDWARLAAAAERDMDAPPVVLGDVAVALETTLREAEAAELPPQEHFARLIAHGVLHLCGFDHISHEGGRAMHETESRALTRLGFNRPLVEDLDALE